MYKRVDKPADNTRKLKETRAKKNCNKIKMKVSSH